MRFVTYIVYHVWLSQLYLLYLLYIHAIGYNIDYTAFEKHNKYVQFKLIPSNTIYVTYFLNIFKLEKPDAFAKNTRQKIYNFLQIFHYNQFIFHAICELFHPSYIT